MERADGTRDGGDRQRGGRGIRRAPSDSAPGSPARHSPGGDAVEQFAVGGGARPRSSPGRTQGGGRIGRILAARVDARVRRHAVRGVLSRRGRRGNVLDGAHPQCHERDRSGRHTRHDDGTDPRRIESHAGRAVSDHDHVPHRRGVRHERGHYVLADRAGRLRRSGRLFGRTNRGATEREDIEIVGGRSGGGGIDVAVRRFLHFERGGVFRGRGGERHRGGDRGAPIRGGSISLPGRFDRPRRCHRGGTPLLHGPARYHPRGRSAVPRRARPPAQFRHGGIGSVRDGKIDAPQARGRIERRGGVG
mmetsp:Transcript_33625/g.100283  ORF Transcript_33625/g.100283 Transcript_33625/m.100283 type:complete len:305 (+) Transcript_33625:698-1612(+)